MFSVSLMFFSLLPCPVLCSRILNFAEGFLLLSHILLLFSPFFILCSYVLTSAIMSHMLTAWQTATEAKAMTPNRRSLRGAGSKRRTQATSGAQAKKLKPNGGGRGRAKKFRDDLYDDVETVLHDGNSPLYDEEIDILVIWAQIWLQHHTYLL
jgi:hypothetical protein